MKVIILAVSTLNGKITKNNDPDIYKWTSKADQAYFFECLIKNNLMVMGRKTYNTARNIMQLSKRQLRIVLTKNPKKYKSDEVPGQLEFTNESLRSLKKRLENHGYSQMLVVGGGRVNSGFLKDKLVNEIHLTIEPLIFGKGISFIHEDEFAVKLNLIGLKRLNKQGTLLLRYKVTS